VGVSRCVCGYVSLHLLPCRILAKACMCEKSQVGKRCYLQAVSLLRGGARLAYGAHPVVTE